MMMIGVLLMAIFFFLEDLSGRLVAEEGPPGEGHSPGKIVATFARFKSTSLFVIHQVGHRVGQLKGVLTIVALRAEHHQTKYFCRGLC